MNDHWKNLCTPPAEAMSKIEGGRLSGYTDINPQWRYKAMTEVYGECGEGWCYEIERTWTEPGSDGQVFAFAEVKVLTINRIGGLEYSHKIPGIGGSMLLERQWDKARNESYLFHNDDAFKMAVTDALSVALKFLGVGSDVYEGKLDSMMVASGTKYTPDSNVMDQVAEGTGKVARGKVLSCVEETLKSGSTVYKVLIEGLDHKVDTFKVNMALLATELIKNGMVVEANLEKNRYGWRLLELRPIPFPADSSASDPSGKDDDLPF